MENKTSITLDKYYEDFINREISSGRYTSVEEIIRSALRLLENREQKIENLRNALELGEKSNFVENFNPKEHLKELHSKYL